MLLPVCSADQVQVGRQHVGNDPEQIHLWENGMKRHLFKNNDKNPFCIYK